MRSLANYIQKFAVPGKESARIYRHITNNKQPRSAPNPIKYYYENKKAPFTQHLYTPLGILGIAPPKDRKRDTLPYQWRQYIKEQYGEQQQQVS